ncbi:MAG: aminoacyl-tRNA hydrolase [gamma proteobacterium symbiont of Bathyaustriella thionipta]|nr:aminoacyl-tRNA hydrolase [gamma proteobacterium symbiont of Bathyaustriella thionipta]
MAGLGNPGKKYQDTRHNAGFWFVEKIAEQYGARFKKEPRYNVLVAGVEIDGHPLRLVMPQSYMNRSGEALYGLAHYYAIPADAILVAHDDLDLPAGKVKLKKGGGHGGHNGLRDMIARMGKDFARLRFGIGHPGHRDDVVSFVLHKASAEERAAIMGIQQSTADWLPELLAGDWNKVMNQLH